MKRIFHPWQRWEDYKYNFHGGIEYADFDVVNYAELLRDLPRFEDCLKEITNYWPHSCEHNLTNESLNRVAYLGQASCALVYRVAHYKSSSGYNILTPDEQVAADALAEKYLNNWLERHAHKELENVAA